MRTRTATGSPRPGPRERIETGLLLFARGVWFGAQLGFARLARQEIVVVAALAVSLGVMAGVVERSVTPSGGIDRALGPIFGLVIPLVGVVVINMALGRRRLGDAVWCLARHGLSRRSLVVGLLAAAMGAASLLALLTVEAGVVAAGAGTGSRAEPLGRDLWTCGWIAVLAASAYVAWAGWGGTLFRFGQGRWIPLAADFTLGTGTGLWAAVWPRPHVRNLLGTGIGPLELGQRWSSALLVLATVIVGLAACGRSRQ